MYLKKINSAGDNIFVVRPKLTCIMDYSSAILLCEITLSGNSIPILHLFSGRVALRSAVFTAARLRPSVSRHLEISFGLKGPSPRLLPPSGGLGSSPGAWSATNKGNADGAVRIFGNAGHVWATVLRSDPP